MRLLATSREPLRVAAERTYAVPPLVRADAVALFVERAQAVAFWTALLDHHLGEARAALGPEAEAVWQAGQRLSLQEAVAEASAS